ncbi:ABC transporter ATP-binding protein [Paenibacillus sp. Marseille-Q4541]|uniref:ABC transporter ATP-binding protein n=1 Tax=Paenibacillus sp. Marseille-Q4541 TaxID=2831522 RepID=UPI001BA80AA5|nr:ABC transporter ATP-binding protein [Paenibacillus sp. Marseille-Q4541]
MPPQVKSVEPQEGYTYSIDRPVEVAVAGLRLKFPGEPQIWFRNLSLTITKGEKVLLLGASGSGKSTLLQVLSGLIPHSIDVPMKVDESTIPPHAGIVFQDPDTQFCMPYVDEELAFVLENRQVPRDEMQAQIKELLSLVGLELTDVHTSVQALSQGMKQRLAIASVLAMEPEVLFLDEPTALLDEQGTLEVWDTIRQVARERTVIIVEHKIDHILGFVDRIVVLSSEGEVIADGDAVEVFVQQQRTLADYGIWYPGVWNEHSLPPRQPLPSSCEHQPEPEPILLLQDVTIQRGGQSIIQAEELKVLPGDFIGIMGPNGAGKSSLLLGLMKLLPITGTYLINGVHPRNTKQAAEQIAFVFQNPEFQFVTHSVWNEVEYSLLFEPLTREQRSVRVEELLRRFHLHGLEDRHPYELSLGQKRRLSVASAIVRKQPILLLDEPTFGQDARNTFAMLDELERLRSEGTAIVMVTHDKEISARYCTSVWKAAEGRVTTCN